MGISENKGCCTYAGNSTDLSNEINRNVEKIIIETYNSNCNYFYKIKAAIAIQRRYRWRAMRKRIKRKITFIREDMIAEAEKIYSRRSKNNDSENWNTRKEEDGFNINKNELVNSSNKRLRFFLKQQSHKTFESMKTLTSAIQLYKPNDEQFNEILKIKGNFLNKEGKMIYIQNPEFKKKINFLKTWNTISENLARSKTFNENKIILYYGYLKWEDGSKLHSLFKVNTDYIDLKTISKNGDEAVIHQKEPCVNGVALFKDEALKYSFQGEYKNNKPRGYGVLTVSNLEMFYEGVWNGRSLNGVGVEVWSDGTFYRGTFENGWKHGIGIYRWPDGTIYQGEFYQNEMRGIGVIIYNDDRMYEGDIWHGSMHGIGKFTFPDGKIYYGEYFDDIKSGFGYYVMKMKPVEAYIGFWINGKPEGVGVKVVNNSIKYGIWRNGERKIKAPNNWEFKDLVMTNTNKASNIKELVAIAKNSKFDLDFFFKLTQKGLGFIKEKIKLLE